ncbi:galactose-specific lectin nattectin-like [Centroberyx affinis]|uniref:galactose-specific lectin nattectin-like n=1 Tax=Centroberyx affinis TaxID=166261 RepID=UPI003A5BC5F3
MKILTVSLLLCAMMALTIGLVSVVDTASECPKGWTPLNHRCFLYVPKQMTWAQAENHCVLLGGHLASINSHSEAKAAWRMIKRITKRKRKWLPVTWLGGSDAKKEGVWLWSDGQPFNYRLWSRGNPDNKWKRQDCLVMNYRGKKRWDDQSCNGKKPSLCAKTTWDADC